jgi:hypothetical protein
MMFRLTTNGGIVLLLLATSEAAFAQNLEASKLAGGIVVEGGALQSSKISPGIVLENTSLMATKIAPGIVLENTSLMATKISAGIVVEALPPPALTPGLVPRAPLTHW